MRVLTDGLLGDQIEHEPRKRIYVVQGSHGGCVSNLFQLGQSVNGAAEQRGNLRRIAVPNFSCALGRRDKTRDRLTL